MLFSLSVDSKELTNARDSTFHVIEGLARLRIWIGAEFSNQPFLYQNLQRRGKVPSRPDETPINQLII